METNLSSGCDFCKCKTKVRVPGTLTEIFVVNNKLCIAPFIEATTSPHAPPTTFKIAYCPICGAYIE